MQDYQLGHSDTELTPEDAEVLNEIGASNSRALRNMLANPDAPIGFLVSRADDSEFDETMRKLME